MKSSELERQVTDNSQITNHFGRSSNFTSKVGLCSMLRNVHWYTHSDPDTFYPRCYNLSNVDDRDAFFDNYRLTACSGFIKHFLRENGVNLNCYGDMRRPMSSIASSSARARRHGARSAAASASARNLTLVDCNLNIDWASFWAEDAAFNQAIHSDGPSSDGLESNGHLQEWTTTDNVKSVKIVDSLGNTDDEEFDSGPIVLPPVSVRALRIATDYCRCYLQSRDHEDIDGFELDLRMEETDWLEYFQWFHQYVHEARPLEAIRNLPLLLNACRDLMLLMRQRCLQFDLDGSRNIWILKPGAKSRGRGVRCVDRYEELMEDIEKANTTLVVQKYIESPFLIHKTKFDIRQWFLVTDWKPLTVWWYADCYLKFSSQRFSLNSLDAAVHLCNNSVQKHAPSSASRSSSLPGDNAWTSDEFQDFLRRRGYGRVWQQQIVPAMQQAILCTLLASQEHMRPRKNSFEIYGADFILSEDLKAWLIEINSSPSMSRTSRATAVLVDHVTEDLLKVILDRRVDRHCDTGKFELLYKQHMLSNHQNTTGTSSAVNLFIQGQKIQKFKNVK